MAHIHIVPTDMRVFLPSARPLALSEEIVESEGYNECPASHLSFAELHIFLERAKPSDENLKYANPETAAQRNLSQQQFHHNERLNFENSVRGSMGSEAVYLSADAMVS